VTYIEEEEEEGGGKRERRDVVGHVFAPLTPKKDMASSPS